jgi:hypothetical protein
MYAVRVYSSRLYVSLWNDRLYAVTQCAPAHLISLLFSSSCLSLPSGVCLYRYTVLYKRSTPSIRYILQQPTQIKIPNKHSHHRIHQASAFTLR